MRESSRYFIVHGQRHGILDLQQMVVQQLRLAQGVARVSAVMGMWWLLRFDAIAVPTHRAPPQRRERSPDMSDMIRESQLIEMMRLAEENLGYMSDMALELAQMADHAGHVTLAYLFRMAALEASTAEIVIAVPRDGRHRTTSH